MLPFLTVSDVPTPPAIIVPAEKKETTKPAPYVIPPKDVPVEYIVVENDNLTKIAEAQKTTVQRLWEKNTSLTNPDLINIGDKLVIPKDDEQLTPRPLPVIVVATPSVSAPAGTPHVASPRGTVAGNTYSYGYCTWYVKNRRPDLPNNLGNADTWTIRAANQGIPTGSSPRAGAVGQKGMHVVYVESVNGDGSMNISEMNYQGWNVQSSRTTSSAGWNFIY